MVEVLLRQEEARELEAPAEAGGGQEARRCHLHTEAGPGVSLQVK